MNLRRDRGLASLSGLRFWSWRGGVLIAELRKERLLGRGGRGCGGMSIRRRKIGRLDGGDDWQGGGVSVIEPQHTFSNRKIDMILRIGIPVGIPNLIRGTQEIPQRQLNRKKLASEFLDRWSCLWSSGRLQIQGPRSTAIVPACIQENQPGLTTGSKYTHLGPESGQLGYQVSRIIFGEPNEYPKPQDRIPDRIPGESIWLTRLHFT